MQFWYPLVLECPIPVQHSLFSDCFLHFQPVGLDGAVNTGEEEGHSLDQQIMAVFVEQPLASPGSAYHDGFP